VFGSDWPGIPSIEGQVDLLGNLPLARKIIDAILLGNKNRLLGIVS